MPKPSASVLFPTIAALALSACARSDERLDRVAVSQSAVDDKWENTNRSIYEVSTKVDNAVLRPVTNAYRTVIPQAPRRAVSNAYSNLKEPRYFVNAVLQGKIKSAFRAVDRLLVNSTLGLGISDPATDMGLSVQPHDFGQTMAVWGVPSGPYFYMPLLGPSTARDAVGFVVDFFSDPVDKAKADIMTAEQKTAMLGLRVIDTRSQVMDQGEQLMIGAADPYATMRSAWLQLRRYEIFDGAPPATEDEEDIPPPPYEDEVPAEAPQ